MSETKHTPGPWEIDGHTIYTLEHHGWFKGNEEFRNRFWCSVSGYRETPKEEIAANIRLIAAAPDLLAACQAALQVLDSFGDTYEVEADAARAAIVKATEAAREATEGAVSA